MIRFIFYKLYFFNSLERGRNFVNSGGNLCQYQEIRRAGNSSLKVRVEARDDVSLTSCVCVCVCQSLCHVQLSVTPWTVPCQAPLSKEFPRQEYWSGLPFASPEDLPNPRIEPGSPALQMVSLPSEPHYLTRMVTVKEVRNGCSQDLFERRPNNIF